MDWFRSECRKADDTAIGPERADARRDWRKAFWMANNRLADPGPFWQNGWWVFRDSQGMFKNRIRHKKLLEMTEVLERRVVGA